MRRIRLGVGVWLNSRTKTNKYHSCHTYHMSAVNFGVTFPKPLLKKLDQARGDVPRSVYLQRIFEESMESRK